MAGSHVAERFTVAAGIEARYLVEGRGVPVLLLHGGALGSSADVWERNLSPLASHGLRPIAVDLPGTGGTADPLEFTEAYRRRFLLELLDALEVDRAGIVGHSSAGGLSVTLGFEHPDRISRVMVLGTQSLLPPLPASEGEGAGDGDGARSGREPTVDDVRAVLREQLFDHSFITPEVLETRFRMGTRRPDPAQRAQAQADRVAERQRGVPLWNRLDQAPIPLCMVYGADDRPNTVQRVTQLRERYPNLDIRLLDRCRHIIQWDAADQFTALAGEFFGAA